MTRLSAQATAKRERDFLEVAGKATIIDWVAFILWGACRICVYAVQQMAKKMTPQQRAALISISVLVGGIMIILAARSGSWTFGLVIGILLGILLVEIARL